MPEFKDYDWQCRDCGHQWDRENGEHYTPKECPKCKSVQVTTIAQVQRDEAINVEDDYREDMRL